jgi:hypothetical protein
VAERSDLTNSADHTGDTSLILEGKPDRRDDDRDPGSIKPAADRQRGQGLDSHGDRADDRNPLGADDLAMVEVAFRRALIPQHECRSRCSAPLKSAQSCAFRACLC